MCYTGKCKYEITNGPETGACSCPSNISGCPEKELDYKNDYEFEKCPHCNNEDFRAYVVSENSTGDCGMPGLFWTRCTVCGMRGPMASSRFGAQQKWNDLPRPLDDDVIVKEHIQILRTKIMNAIDDAQLHLLSR